MNEHTSADQPNVQERQKTNGWAIASFTLGVWVCINPLLYSLPGLYSLSGLDTPFLGLVVRALPLIVLFSQILSVCIRATPCISIVAIIVGVIAMLKIKKSEPRQKGAGLAIAGIIIGALTIIVYGGLLVYGIWVNYLR